MARLILDTGVLIRAARGRLQLSSLSGNDNLAVPAVAVAEFLQGVRLTRHASEAERQRAFLRDTLVVAPVVDYTFQVAEEHGALLAHVRHSGSPRGRHDLIIAATARASDRTIVTTDTHARFDDLPGVSVRYLEPS
ncbi:MAG: PIN domain-containing protein [Pseudonocardia sp.]|nr:PIN domain-containing protein [Pseudonocardia sp.]